MGNILCFVRSIAREKSAIGTRAFPNLDDWIRLVSMYLNSQCDRVYFQVPRRFFVCAFSVVFLASYRIRFVRTHLYRKITHYVVRSTYNWPINSERWWPGMQAGKVRSRRRKKMEKSKIKNLLTSHDRIQWESKFCRALIFTSFRFFDRRMVRASVVGFDFDTLQTKETCRAQAAAAAHRE